MENDRISELRNMGFFVPETIADVGRRGYSPELRAEMLERRLSTLPKLNPGDRFMMKNRLWEITEIRQTPTGLFKYAFSPLDNPKHSRDMFCSHFLTKIELGKIVL